MKHVSLVAFAILALIIQSCGSDRQLDSNPAVQAPEQGIDSSGELVTVPDIDLLLADGNRFETLFNLDPALPASELVFMESGTLLEASLRADGFDGPLVTLAVTVSNGDKSPNVLLLIRKDGIFDGNGNRLVEQVHAKHGYAWRVGNSSVDGILARRSFISVIILDEDGAGVSDELFIYWKSTHGTEGSFVVTNIPNEIL